MDIENEKKMLEKRLMELDVYEQIRNHIQEDIKWNAMICHPADDEHEDYYYTEPNEGDYNYDRYIAYKTILEKFDKAMSK